MPWRNAVLTGLAFCALVASLIARPRAAFHNNQTKPGPASDALRDSRSLSSLSLYDPNPNHLWNRLYRQFHVRKAWDEREYGGDVLDPLLWEDTRYLITGASHQQALSVLDEFLSTHGERLITDPLKRAMLQRDLWAVFEWASDLWNVEDSKPNRVQLERKLVQVMQHLALSPEQIQALPDTYALATAAKAFPTDYNPTQRETPFLPADLFQPNSAWVNLGTVGEGGAQSGSGAPAHTIEFGSRSLFLVFIRLPGGRDATLGYLKQLADFPTPCIPSPDQFHMVTRDPLTGGGTGLSPSAPVPNPDLPQFPRGTQVLLLRRMMLIDREGQLKPTNLVESVQIRVFEDIPSRAEWLAAPSKSVQDVFEFRLSRRKLFVGDAGGLHAVTHDDWEFPTIFIGPHFDRLQGEPGAGPSMGTLSDPEHRGPVILNTCVHCHGAPGVQSMAAARSLFGQGACTTLRFYATSAGEQAEQTIDWKRRQYNWGLLQGLWLSNADQTSSESH